MLADTSGASKGVKGFAGQLRNTGQTMVSTGATWTRNVSLPIVTGLTAAYVKTGQFRKAMDEVSAKAEGAWDKSGEAFQRLRQKVQDLGRETNYTAVQVAEGAAFMAQAGQNAYEIYEGLDDVLYMAGAGNMDFARAADISTNVMRGFNLEASEMGRVADVLAYVSSKSNVNVEKLGETMKYLAPVAAAMGISLEESAAMAGMLGDAGIQGSLAGTQLRQGLVKVIDNSDKASEAIERLGVNLRDAEGNALGFYEIISQLEDAGATAADINAIFGTRPMSAFLAAMAQGSDKLADFTADAQAAEGAAKAMYDRMVESDSFTRFTSSMEALGIAVGESGLFDSVARFLDDSATPFIRQLAQMPPGQMDMLVKGLVTLAAVGPSMMILGQGMIGLSAGINVVSKLGPVCTAAGSAIAGMAAAAGVSVAAMTTAIVAAVGIWVWNIYYAISHWDQLKTNSYEWGLIFKYVHDSWVYWLRRIEGGIRNFERDVNESWATFWHGVKEDWSRSWLAFTNAAKLKWASFKLWWDEKWTEARTWVSTTWEGILEDVGYWWDLISGKVWGWVNDILGHFRFLDNESVRHSIIPDMWKEILRVTDTYTDLVERSVAKMTDEIKGEFSQLQAETAIIAQSIAASVLSPLDQAIAKVEAIRGLAAQLNSGSSSWFGDRPINEQLSYSEFMALAESDISNVYARRGYNEMFQAVGDRLLANPSGSGVGSYACGPGG